MMSTGIQPPLKESRILIGVPTCEFSRQASFYDYLDLLEKPLGTLISRTHGQSPARGRNMLIKKALEYDCTHVFFIDDDIILPPNTLTKLVMCDVDMVTGLYYMRNHPHQPIIFDQANELGHCGHRYLQDGDKGLVPLVAAGLGACLIKTEVFKGMESNPENKGEWVRLGELERDHWCDDIGFFRRARMAGFKLFVDLESPVGHMASVTIWPNRVNGVWETVYDTTGRAVIHMPQPKSAAVDEPKPLWSDQWNVKELVAK